MAYSKDASRTGSKRSFDIDLSGADSDWREEPPQGRDWKKMVLVIGLGALSWVATYIGMLELIQSNMGDLPLIHKAVIGFSVAMLMTMIIWLLDQMFAPIPTATKLTYVGGYVFLTLISVGFGFGFYWKVLESRSESSRSAESAVTQVQSSLHAASTRMTQLSATLEQLTQVSTQKAEIERVKGTSCPNSRPGDGPRRKLRDDDAQRFSFAADFVKGRVEGVKKDLTGLDGDLAKVVSDDKSTIDAASGTRNDFLRALGHKLDITVTGFNAFRTDPQLKQLRADLAERSEKTIFPDSRGGTFACPDPQLQQALKGVVRAIDQLPDLEKPKIAAVEGSEATIEAFRRLTATFYGALSFKLPPSADELRDLQKKAVQSVEASPAVQKALAGDPTVGLSRRDYIPLSIAIFVDLCLLLVSMSRPMNRLHGLVPKMRAAERGPVIQILSRFNEIHRDDEIRQNFEVFRHVVFDFHGAYYVAVPLDAPYKPSGPYSKSYSTEDVQDLQLEAHLLGNLFTSFEKEKIFTRVYSPLLTTRSIKKKLLRQGSKFAHADAFRVYRFRDGAWSEIILGAVMGAARRVEAEKKKRRLEEQLFTSHEPVLSAANDHTQPATATKDTSLSAPQTATATPPSPLTNDRFADRQAGADRRGGGFFSRQAARAAAAAAVQAPSDQPTDSASLTARLTQLPGQDTSGTIAEFGPYAKRASREIEEQLYRSTLPTLRGEDGALDRPRPRRKSVREPRQDEMEQDITAGEVVLFAIPGSTPVSANDTPIAGAEQEPLQTQQGQPTPGRRMEHDTATAAVPSPIATVSVTPTTPARAFTPEPRVGVVLRRETAEFTMPVTEANLPGSLLAAGFELISKSSEAALFEAQANEPQTGTGLAAPVVLPLLQADGSKDDPVMEGMVAEPLTRAVADEAGHRNLEPETDEFDSDAAPLFDEPDIDIRIDDISRRFRPTAAE